ncbi:hypothetical protein CXG81DRAFT_9481 [Caulochytrium protostelioides]|uniref:Mob1/phocein n=1 Tax=Caulochytrium protostelioides TaxID=1555241 RepID=A0A4P9XEA9_9FUNG|nr:hypothetical protein CAUPRSCDRAFT_7046 [Caulochytrium protostelioides]RKP03481.1 hypothetical protein CXG81DRAFT_9481 [Caulochytrium protostelioides]|eukprot:RKP03481.1 hypothetical protein CXG81DRAFT_9481 [Caulochytrium protostelioides]
MNFIQSKLRLRRSSGSSRGQDSSHGSGLSGHHAADPPPVPLYRQPPYVEAILVNGKLSKVVRLPRYVDQDEWLAANVFSFFHSVNRFYGAVTEYCTATTCPTMSGPDGTEYLWSDRHRKASRVPAMQYIDFVMTWIQNQVEDEAVFPTKTAKFPKDFGSTVRAICKQMFRLFAHIYHAHFDVIVAVKAEAHVNTLFAHFMAFCLAFDLLDKKEYAPMAGFLHDLQELGRL